MNNDIFFMKKALNEAKKAFYRGEIPIGAIIVKNGKIISSGYNLRESRKISTKHAEIIAIEKACKKLNNWRLINCTIYITMLPCPMCASAINQSRISKIVYGTVPDYANMASIKKILNDKFYGSPVKIAGPILENDCAEILKKFFREKR